MEGTFPNPMLDDGAQAYTPLDWPDPSHGPSHAQLNEGVQHANVALPAGEDFLRADFARSGSDLLIETPSGGHFVIVDYFLGSNPPALETADGAVLSANMVTHLAGPQAPAMVAQTAGVGFAGLGEPIGQMSESEGTVSVTHADGVKAALSIGDPVFQGDVLETGVESSAAVVFVDDTIFTLDGDGRMIMDEMVYDPDTQSGVFNAQVVQGVFSFVSGKVAKTAPDAMVITTPTNTIGIRGSTVLGEAAAEGAENKITLVTDVDGNVGEIIVSTPFGSMVLSVPGASTSVFSANLPPSAMVVLTPQQIQQDYGSSLTNLVKTVAKQAVQKAEQAQQKAQETQQEAEQVQQEAEQSQEEAAQADQAAAEAEAEAQAAEAEAEALAAEAEAAIVEAEAAGDPEAVAKAQAMEAKAEAAAAKVEDVKAEAEAAAVKAAEVNAQAEEAAVKAATMEQQAADAAVAADQQMQFSSMAGSAAVAQEQVFTQFMETGFVDPAFAPGAPPPEGFDPNAPPPGDGTAGTADTVIDDGDAAAKAAYEEALAAGATPDEAFNAAAMAASDGNMDDPAVAAARAAYEEALASGASPEDAMLAAQAAANQFDFQQGGFDPNAPSPEGFDPNAPPPEGFDPNAPPPEGFDPNAPPPGSFDPNAPMPGGPYDPMMGMGPYDPMMGGMYDPMMGGMYDPMFDPMYDPMMGGMYDPMMGGMYDPYGMYDPMMGGIYDPMFDPMMYDPYYDPYYDANYYATNIVSVFDEFFAGTLASETLHGTALNTNYYFTHAALGGTDTIIDGGGSNQVSFDLLSNIIIQLTATGASSGDFDIRTVTADFDDAAFTAASGTKTTIDFSGVTQYLFSDISISTAYDATHSGTTATGATTTPDMGDVMVFESMTSGEVGYAIAGSTTADAFVLDQTAHGMIVFGKGGGDTFQVKTYGATPTEATEHILIGSIWVSGTSDATGNNNDLKEIDNTTAGSDGIPDTNINVFDYSQLLAFTNNAINDGTKGVAVHLDGFAAEPGGDAYLSENVTSPFSNSRLNDIMWDVGSFIGTTQIDAIEAVSGSFQKIDGFSGNDVMSITGTTKVAYVYGGAGNDVIEVDANLLTNSALGSTLYGGITKMLYGGESDGVTDVGTDTLAIQFNESATVAAADFGVASGFELKNASNTVYATGATISLDLSALTGFTFTGYTGTSAASDETITLNAEALKSGTTTGLDAGSGTDTLNVQVTAAYDSLGAINMIGFETINYTFTAGADGAAITANLSGVTAGTTLTYDSSGGTAAAETITAATTGVGGGAFTLTANATGTDTLILSGGGTINSTNMAKASGFEQITLGSDAGYSLTLNNVGANLIIEGAAVTTGSNVIAVDGTAVSASLLTLNGGVGNDALTGGGGVDTIFGGQGGDQLTGNGGADIFKYTAANEAGDTIFDFAGGAGGDTLQFTIASFGVGAVSYQEIAWDGVTTTGLTFGNTGINVAVLTGGSAGTLADVKLALVNGDSIATNAFVVFNDSANTSKASVYHLTDLANGAGTDTQMAVLDNLTTDLAGFTGGEISVV